MYLPIHYYQLSRQEVLVLIAKSIILFFLFRELQDIIVKTSTNSPEYIVDANTVENVPVPRNTEKDGYEDKETELQRLDAGSGFSEPSLQLPASLPSSTISASPSTSSSDMSTSFNYHFIIIIFPLNY